MIATDDLDRTISGWLAADAAAGRVDYLAEALDRVDRTRQRRGASAAIARAAGGLDGLPSRGWLGHLPGRAVAVAATVLLLIAALLATALIAGSRPVPPFGRAATGQLLFVSRPTAGQANQVMVAGPDGSNPRPLTSSSGYKDAPAWSRDGTRVAYLFTSRDQMPAADNERPAFQVRVADADGRDDHAIAERIVGRQVFPQPVWSPDGRQVAIAGDDGIAIAASDGSGVRWLTSRRSGGDVLAWAPDGSALLVMRLLRPTSGRGLFQPTLVSTVDGTETQVGGPVRGSGASWSPDGASIAFDGLLLATRTGTGWSLRSLIPPFDELPGVTWRRAEARGTGVAFSNDGTRVAFTTSLPPAVRVVDVATGGTTLVAELADVEVDLGNLAWSPDDRWLAVRRADGVVAYDASGAGRVLELPAGIDLQTAAEPWQRIAP